MNKHFCAALLICLTVPSLGIASSLIVVDDRGGPSALPYYQDLAPQPTPEQTDEKNLGVQSTGAFPVRSDRLTLGTMRGRVINAPGLQPMFVIGDDSISRMWLTRHEARLQQLQAVGIVVNVASAERFAKVRGWAAGLEMMPASADDLAERLGVSHYPLLITATTIQQ